MSRTLLLLPVLVAGLALAGCSGHGQRNSDATRSQFNLGADTGQAQSAAQPRTTTGAATGSAAGPAAGAAAKSEISLQTRDIVRTATLDVTVADVDRAADAAISATTAAGGRSDTDDRTTDGADRHAHLVLRLPVGKLSAVMAGIARSGHENSRSDHGEDVTAQHADVDARVAELRISVARLENFLQHSGSINELISLENQLTQRQSDLQSTLAQQRALADEISLSTLTVDLSATLPPAARSHAGPPGFGSALGHGLHALVIAVRVVLAGAGYLVPFLIVLVPVGFLLGLVAHRRRAGRPHASRGSGEPAATP